MRRLSVLFFFVIGTVPFATAAELKVSSAALQRTLVTRLFTADNGRHYLHGNANSGCYAYADSPGVTFAGERIQVGYDVSLDSFQLHSMQIARDLLVIDIDSGLTVR